MKKNILALIALSGMIAFSGCNKKAEEKPEVIETPAITKTDSIATPEAPAAETKTVEGVVKSSNHGKDGYTAEIETADKEIYFATISHSNLTNHEQYKEVKAGETLKVTGDFWKMEDKNQITVRVIE